MPAAGGLGWGFAGAAHINDRSAPPILGAMLEIRQLIRVIVRMRRV